MLSGDHVVLPVWQFGVNSRPSVLSIRDCGNEHRIVHHEPPQEASSSSGGVAARPVDCLVAVGKCDVGCGRSRSSGSSAQSSSGPCVLRATRDSGDVDLDPQYFGDVGHLVGTIRSSDAVRVLPSWACPRTCDMCSPSLVVRPPCG